MSSTGSGPSVPDVPAGDEVNIYAQGIYTWRA